MILWFYAAALSVPPPSLQMYLYIPAPQNLTSAGTPPFPLPVSLLQHSGACCWDTLVGQSSTCTATPALELHIYKMLPGSWSWQFWVLLRSDCRSPCDCLTVPTMTSFQKGDTGRFISKQLRIMRIATASWPLTYTSFISVFCQHGWFTRCHWFICKNSPGPVCNANSLTFQKLISVTLFAISS